jgi:hypothetical protein
VVAWPAGAAGQRNAPGLRRLSQEAVLIVADGESQSAARMVTYADAIQPLDRRASAETAAVQGILLSLWMRQRGVPAGERCLMGGRAGTDDDSRADGPGLRTALGLDVATVGERGWGFCAGPW